MLTPDFLWHAADKVVALWEKFNVTAILDICRRILDAGGHMTATAEWQIYKMEQSGMARDDIMRAVKKVTKLSEEEVRRVFEEAAVESHGNDADIFAQAGVPTQPLNTKAARDAMQTFYEQTNGELSNFTRTTANAAQRIYIQACDDAFLKVRSGLMSQDQAIREAIEKAAADGLYVTYPSGHRDTVEVAVRRAVATGVNRAAQQLTIDECERQGTNYVIVSSHLGARVSDDNPIANHAGWQGQVYMIKPRQRGFWGALSKFMDIVKRQNYPLLREATGYPDDPLGLGGYNCRHSMYPYIPGITRNHMTQYDSEENRRAYELSQEQRKREREIRRTKRELEGAKLCGDTEKARELQARLKRQQADYRDFCSRNGLRENFERTYTAKATPSLNRTFEPLQSKIDSKPYAMSRGGRQYTGSVWKKEGTPIDKATHEDLSAYAQERGIRLESFENFDGDPQLIREAIDTLHEIGQVFPRLLSQKKQLQLRNSFRFINPDDDYAQTSTMTISLNNYAYRDKGVLEKDYRGKVEDGWFTKGSTYKDIIVHEAGHLLAQISGKRQRGILAGGVFDPGMREMMIRTLVSEYATINDHELIAECFVRYWNGDRGIFVLNILKKCGIL